MHDRPTTRARWIWLVVLGAAALTGCAPLQLNAPRPPLLVAPQAADDIFGDSASASLSETWYAEATRLDAEGSAAAVDAYLQAAVAAWPAVEIVAHGIQANTSFDGATANPVVLDSREWDLYQSSVAGLLIAAQKYNRWNSATGLVATGPQGLAPVETAYHGFVWAPTEFGALHPVGDAAPARPEHTYRRAGLGVPLVVDRNDSGAPRPFVEPGRQFAATAVVRPVQTAAGPIVRLEFYDPLRESYVPLGHTAIPLASDLSAPLASTGVNFRQAWLEPFLRPAVGGADDRLEMIEPFQADKIPVLFVHGLLSDPATWTDMVNELQAQPHLIRRYQIWMFRYDTGEPFLTSAAALRRQLRQLHDYYSPCGANPMAAQIVVVGHSMGGLIANLQVAYSGDALWNAAAHIPLDHVVTDAATRTLLADAFYFDPSEQVARVIYIGTPHLGSGYARRAVGSLGAALVETAPLNEQRHAQLMRDNPGAFSEELSRRFPTSVDLLDPESPILNATARLPYRPGVAVHSIIGEGRYTLGSGPSDGVVPVSSARLSGVNSEKFVTARHSQEPRDENVVAEVLRILAEHAAAVEASLLTSPGG